MPFLTNRFKKHKTNPSDFISLGIIILILMVAVIFTGCSKSTEPEPGPDPVPEKESETYIGPHFTILSPPRAGMIKAGNLLDEYPVDMSGTVCDSFHTITLCKIEGDFLTPGTGICTPINFQKNSRCGLSIVNGTVMNDEGWTGFLAQSFLRSPSFYPEATAPDPTARAGHALSMYLMDDFFDDDDNAMDDIASILDYCLNLIDYNSLFPTFIVKPASADNEAPIGVVDKTKYNCGLWSETNYETCIALTRGTLSVGPISTSIELTEPGMDINVLFDKITQPVTLKGYLDLECLGEQNTSKNITVSLNDVNIELNTSISLDEVNAKPRIDVTGVAITIEGQTVNNWINSKVNSYIDCGIFGFLGCDWAKDKMKDALKDAVDGPINKIPGMIQDQLDNIFSKLKPNYSITLPPQLQKYFKQNLIIENGFDAAETVELTGSTRALALGTYVQVYPETPKAEHLAKQYGAIKYGSTLPLGCSSCSYGVGIRDDFFNQFLWALWLGGSFDMDDISEFLDNPSALSGIELSIFPNLPPVIQTSGDGEGIDLAWGDVYVDVTITPDALSRLMAESGKSSQLSLALDEPLHIEAYLSAVLGIASLLIDEPSGGSQNFRVAFNAMPEVAMQITAIHDPELAGLLNAELEETVQKMVNEALVNISKMTVGTFPVPEFTIPAMGPTPSMKLKLSTFVIERQKLEHLYFISGDLLAIPL